jgi:hypothetical protein
MGAILRDLLLMAYCTVSKHGRRIRCRFFISAVGAGLFGASASAAFLGFVTETTIGAPGRTVTRVYARFNNPSDTLLSISQIHTYSTFGAATGIGAGNFWHQDFLNGNVSTTFAGTWNPAFLLTGNVNVDSWVTIGGQAADFSNTTAADSGWGGTAFHQPGIPDTPQAGVAGWFNNTPSNLQGRGILYGSSDFRVLVGNFVLTEGNGLFLSMNVSYDQGNGTPVQTVLGCFGMTLAPPQDPDGDGVYGCSDNCSLVANPTQADCDDDGIGDACDEDPDSDSDGIPDTCDCPGDLNQSGAIDAEDLASVLFAWGTDGGKTPQADIDRSGTVDANDLSVVLGSWGPCPG